MPYFDLRESLRVLKGDYAASGWILVLIAVLVLIIIALSVVIATSNKSAFGPPTAADPVGQHMRYMPKSDPSGDYRYQRSLATLGFNNGLPVSSYWPPSDYLASPDKVGDFLNLDLSGPDSPLVVNTPEAGASLKALSDAAVAPSPAASMPVSAGDSVVVSPSLSNSPQGFGGRSGYQIKSLY